MLGRGAGTNPGVISTSPNPRRCLEEEPGVPSLRRLLRVLSDHRPGSRAENGDDVETTGKQSVWPTALSFYSHLLLVISSLFAFRFRPLCTTEKYEVTPHHHPRRFASRPNSYLTTALDALHLAVRVHSRVPLHAVLVGPADGVLAASGSEYLFRGATRGR